MNEFEKKHPRGGLGRFTNKNHAEAEGELCHAFNGLNTGGSQFSPDLTEAGFFPEDVSTCMEAVCVAPIKATHPDKQWKLDAKDSEKLLREFTQFANEHETELLTLCSANWGNEGYTPGHAVAAFTNARIGRSSVDEFWEVDEAHSESILRRAASELSPLTPVRERSGRNALVRLRNAHEVGYERVEELGLSKEPAVRAVDNYIDRHWADPTNAEEVRRRAREAARAGEQREDNPFLANRDVGQDDLSQDLFFVAGGVIKDADDCAYEIIETIRPGYFKELKFSEKQWDTTFMTESWKMQGE